MEREAETQAGGKQALCREPDVGLSPRTPGSWPEPKADAQPLQIVSLVVFFFFNIIYVKRSCLRIGLGSVSLSIVTITLHCWRECCVYCSCIWGDLRIGLAVLPTFAGPVHTTGGQLAIAWSRWLGISRVTLAVPTFSHPPAG